MKKLIGLAAILSAGFAAEGLHVIGKIKIGGTGGWDYCTLDTAARRLYVSHATSVAVVDVDASKVVGTIEGLKGVHGIAVAPGMNKGFISNGQSNSVTVFDLKSLAKTGEVATGQNPDAICYEPRTKRVFTFNGRSNDATAIDAGTNAVVATIPLGGKPEFCVVDGAGKLYVNIEDTNEVVELDAAKPAVTRRAALAPCETAVGLALDAKGRKLFTSCRNKVMAVTDVATFKVVGTAAIGAGTDGAGFDPGTGLAFSSNGRDGTLTVVKQVDGKYQPVETVTTAVGAKTMAVDPKAHRVYLPAAEYGPVPEAKAGDKKESRAPVLPDTFHVLVVGK